MEQSPELDFEHYASIMPSRKSRVEAYIHDRMTITEREIAVDHANAFYRPKTMIAKTIVLIPVAAHQEALQIPIALDEYARQTTEQPFTVLLYLNWPRELNDSDQVNHTIAVTEEAIAKHPQLDVRMSHECYIEPSIGMIRRDLWNSALLLAHHEGLFDAPGDDVVGINHDIDVEHMTPRYIERIQTHFDDRQRLAFALQLPDMEHRPSGTLARHSKLPNHPNISKTVFWSDFAVHQVRRYGGFEAGLVVPFSWYVKSGGFNTTHKTHETRPFNRYRRKAIPGTILYTSPRRYIDRVAEQGIANIWSDESFTATDPCREPAQKPDITFGQAEEIIFDVIETHINDYFIMPTVHETSDESFDKSYEFTRTRLEQRFTRSLKLADRALRNIIGSDALADIVASTYNPSELAVKYANQIYKD